MVRHLLLGILALTGCLATDPPAPQTPSKEAWGDDGPAYDPPSSPPAKVEKGPPTLTSAELEPRDCPECDAKRAALNGKWAELERVRAARLGRQHCELTGRQDVRVYKDGEQRKLGRAGVAWICDGKLVDVPESREESLIATDIYGLRRWIRMWCDRGPKLSIERACPT